MFAVGFSFTAFIMLRYVPSLPAFWRVYIINECCIFSKAFSASIEIIICFLSFNLLLWCITLIDLWILKNPCITGIKTTCSDVWSFQYAVGFCLLEFCWGFLHLGSSVILACSFLLCGIFVWRWYLGDGGLNERVWEFTFLCNFLKDFD